MFKIGPQKALTALAPAAMALKTPRLSAPRKATVADEGNWETL